MSIREVFLDTQISDFVTIKKGLNTCENIKSLCAEERMLPSSNLQPLNTLENKRLEKAVSPHKISDNINETKAEVLGRDLVAINKFLYYFRSGTNY